MKSAIKKLRPANGAGNGHDHQNNEGKQKEIELVTKEEGGKKNVLEFAAAANLDLANTDAERKVIQTYGVLEVAESSFQKAGKEFGVAVKELRDEIKKSRSGDWMKRLEELGISYAKARYWLAIVEGKPINRGKKEVAAKSHDSAGTREEGTSHEYWDEASARLREVRDTVILLFDQLQPGDRELFDSFIGELQNFVAMLGYELIAKEGGNGLLQRQQQGSGDVAKGARRKGADRKRGSR